VPELLRRVREAGLHPNGGSRSRLCRPGVSQTAGGGAQPPHPSCSSIRRAHADAGDERAVWQ
jgi:hypothetical protein